MKPWKLLNKQYNAVLFPYAYHIKVMGHEFARTCGIQAPADNYVELRNDGQLTQGFHWDEFHSAGKYILDRLSQRDYAKEVLKNTNDYLDTFFVFSEEIVNSDLREKTNEELADMVQKFVDLFIEVSAWGVLISIVEYEHELLSKKMKHMLARKIKESEFYFSLEEAFQILTINFGKTYVVKERDELLSIAKQIVDNKEWSDLFDQDFDHIMTHFISHRELSDMIAKHSKKYEWLSYGFEGPVLKMSDTINSLLELLKKGPYELEISIEKNEESTKLLQKNIQSKIDFSEEEEHIIWMVKEFGFSKAYRKDIEYHSYYAYDLLLSEIGRRFYFDRHRGRYLSGEELIEILLGKKEVDYNTINDRIQLSVYACEDGEVNIFTGEKAEEYQKHMEVDVDGESIRELQGQCACQGKARGRVKIVLDQKDYSKFQAHDILVSYATNPNMLPLMKISKAIITDMGGVTCHAAIVSRELNTPCIIGTKKATRVLKDGDLVEMDAEKGIIKIIKNDS